MNGELSRKQNKSELDQLKRIDNLLLQQPRSSTSYFKTWSCALQLVAFMDLTSFLYVQKIRFERERIAEVEIANTSHTIMGRIPAMFGVILNKPSRPKVDLPPLHWIERHQYLFDMLFCICWVLEGLRVALKQVHIYYANKEKVSKDIFRKKCTMGLLFISILMLYIMLIPIKWIHHVASIFSKYDGGIMRSNMTNSDMEIFFESKDCSAFSIPYALFLYHMAPFLRAFNAYRARGLKMNLSILIKNNLRKVSRVLRTIVWDPSLFKRRIIQVISTTKSVRRGLPIIGAISRIRKQVSKVIILKHQQYQAIKQRRIKRILWRKISDDERRLKAALRLQSNFRKLQAKKKVEKQFQQQQEIVQQRAVELQEESLMQRAESSRALDSQLVEWLSLKQNLDELDEEGKQLLGSIEKELINSVRVGRQVMAIIKPTSRIWGFWHSMVFVCIVLENLSPLLQLLQLHDVHQIIMIQNSILPAEDNSQIIMILDVIYLLDALVDFFTGRFDEQGELVPETFVARWLPLISKTLSNPITNTFVRASLALCFIHAGPSRMSRWLVAFIIPFGNEMLSIIVWLWLWLIQKCNLYI